MVEDQCTDNVKNFELDQVFIPFFRAGQTSITNVLDESVDAKSSAPHNMFAYNRP